MTVRRGCEYAPSESKEQQALVEWMTLRQIIFMAIPNGGYKISGSEGARLQAEGLKKGVPDLFIVTPPPKRPDLRGVFIEMKRIKGAGSRLSEDQKEWIEKLEANTFAVLVGWGAMSAIEQMQEMGY